MVYEKLNLTDGTVFTAAHVAHIEEGIFNSAPAGYGIGALTRFSVGNDEEIDAALTQTLAGMAAQSFKRIVLSMTTTTNSLNCGGHWYCDIYKQTPDYAIITAKTPVNYGLEVQRGLWAGVLRPWEWVIAPMELGVEYRTTERHNNKVVYKKKVDFGALPSTAEKSVSAMPAGSSLVEAIGYASGASYNIPIPGYYFIKSMGSTRSTGALWISTSADGSAYNAYITLKYTKPEG